MLLAAAGCAWGQVSLSLSSASATAGGNATLNLSLNTAGQAAGLQWTFVYPATDFTSLSVAAGPAATAAGKSVSCNGSAGTYTCLLYGVNSSTISSGVVATATLTVSPTTTSTSSTIQVVNDVAVSASDSTVSATATGGQVTISQAYALTSLVCTPAIITTPGSSSCAVSVSPAAPTGGLTVTTGVGSGATGITMPSSVTVGAGMTGTSFGVASSAVSVNTSALVVASLNGSSKNFSLTLDAPPTTPPPTALPPAPSSITCNATTIAASTSDPCTITLASPAPSGGETVAITLSGSGLTAPASVTVPGGSLSAPFTVQAGTTASGSGTITASVSGVTTVASLTLTISIPIPPPPPPVSLEGGSVSDVANASAAAVNLTAEGGVDWVHWGEPNLNRKTGVTAQLSNYTEVGTGPVSRYNNDPRPLSWTDGSPKPKTASNTDGIFIAGVGNGFSFTAPADTTVRTLTVHVGGWYSSGTLTAHLSDGSAPDFVDTTAVAVGQYDRNYTLAYKAAKTGQTLKITWKMAGGTGNVTLNAAALAAPSGLLKPATSGVNMIETGNSLASSMSLTSEGAADWVHWGDTTLDRKAGVAAQVSTYTAAGTGTVSRYNNDPRPLNWTDGSPASSSTNNFNGIFVAGMGNGFSFTVPADTSVRTLIVHVGGWYSSGTLKAHLSDGSAADVVDTTINMGGQYDRNYTLIFKAATAGQTLKVTWTMAAGSGNVTLNAAALR